MHTSSNPQEITIRESVDSTKQILFGEGKRNRCVTLPKHPHTNNQNEKLNEAKKDMEGKLEKSEKLIEVK